MAEKDRDRDRDEEKKTEIEENRQWTIRDQQTFDDITHPLLTTTLDNYHIPNNTLSLYHTNIHSLPDKYLLLTAHLEHFRQTPDIITLTDNFIDKDTNPNSYPLVGYTHKHTPGVSVYCKHNLHTTFLNTVEIDQVETCILQIHDTKQKTNPIHTIINIYRRPRPMPDFNKNLQNAIDSILTTSPRTDITIQGDININLFNIQPGQPFTDLLIENNLHTTITTPTRHDTRYNTSTLIDPTLTTLTGTHTTAGTLSPPLSDHLPTLTIYHKPPPRHIRDRQKTLSRNRYDTHKTTILPSIQAAISDAQNNNPAATTAEEIHNIQQAIQTIIEKHEKRPKPRRQQWCTPTYRRQIRRQHQLHKRSMTDPTPANIKAHKTYRNKLKRLITAAKRKHLMDQLEKTKDDPKQQAKVLKSVLPSKSQDRTSPTMLTYEGKSHTDPQDIANAMNDFFITVGHKTSQTIPHQVEDCIMQDRPRSTHPPFELRRTDLEEVTKAMNKINRNKASDIFKIKPTIIRDLTPFLAPILTRLFNQAIDEHDYPDPLKLTKVIELFKKTNRTLPKFYRPISLLPIIAKLLDTLINNQLMQHLTTHNIISPTQYAFRPNSNTTLALQTIIDQLLRHIKQKHPTLAVYIDLSKAYDTVSHSKLLHKLRHDFNFTEQTVAFFASYFRNRQQSTHTQHAQSDTQMITHGIPQGSTLSTTFFLLYINDIIKTVPSSTVYTYADDTTLIITAQNHQALQTLAQSELTNLINYFHANNLVPNPTKTNYSIFFPRSPEPIQLMIQTTTLIQNTHAPLLGITVQDNLKHNQTIANIIKKLQPIIQSIRYANKLLPTHILRDTYFTHIFPHFISNISIWGTPDKKTAYIQPLIRTQKKIIRLIKNMPPRTHTQPLMTQLRILNITNLYTLRVATETHPFIHLPKPLNRPEHNHNYISTAHIHDYPTRHSQQRHLYIPNTHHPHKTTDTAHTIDHTTERNTRVWNSVPLEIRQITGLKTFSTKLRNYLLEKQARQT